MAVLACTVLPASAIAGTGLGFSAPVFTSVGAEAIVAADLNGDGTTDLAATDALEHAGAVSLLPGRGDGSFRRPVALPRAAMRPTSPSDLDAADVNGDGRVDLVVSSLDARGLVSVLVNDGGQRFHRDRVYASGPYVFATAVADLNADGLLDIVSAHDAPMELSVLLGAGAGRFAAARQFGGAGAVDVAVGDLNADAKPDVVLASEGKHMVSVRLGNGDGTFAPARTFAPRTPANPRIDQGPGRPSAVALADFNRDGRLDLVLPQVSPTFSRKVSVYLGKGDGTFGAPAVYPASDQQPEAVAVADLDGDGNLDIAAHGSVRISVFRGRPDGTFGPVQAFAPDPFDSGGELLAADFNGDGRPDLATLGGTRLGDLTGTDVFLNWTGLPAPPCVVAPVLRERLPVARREIQRAGCRVGQIRYRDARKRRTGRVIVQRPRYGAVLPSGARVNLVVSRGRRR